MNGLTTTEGTARALWVAETNRVSENGEGIENRKWNNARNKCLAQGWYAREDVRRGSRGEPYQSSKEGGCWLAQSERVWSAAPSSFVLSHSLSVLFPVLLMAPYSRCRRKSKPTPPLIANANPEASIPISRVIEVAVDIAVAIYAGSGPRYRKLPLLLFKLLLLLLDQLARYHTKDFIDALSIFRTDLVTAVPANVLAPESTRPVTLRRGHAAVMSYCWGRPPSHHLYTAPASGLGGCWCWSLRRQHVFGNVCDASLEWHFALGWVFGDNVRFGSDDVKYYVVSEVGLKLLEPSAHLVEGGRIGDVITQDSGVGTYSTVSGQRLDGTIGISRVS
jgi:hypothetical protein